MKTFLLGFKITMAVIYTAIGVYLICYPYALRGVLEPSITRLVGGFFILFGIFRGYRAWFIERNM